MVHVVVYLCLLVTLIAAGNLKYNSDHQETTRGQQKFTPAELRNMLLVGLSNVQKETIDAPVTVDYGNVPKWLNGNYIRHACGAFGGTGHQDDSVPNYIEHLFDCLQIGSKFKIANGTVTFTNRWYKSAALDIYNFYKQDMNQSSVYFSTTFSKQNKGQVDRWRDNMTDPTKVTEIPNVSWWKLGNEAFAMSEFPLGVVVDPETVEQRGVTKYMDNSIGYPSSEGWMFINNPAHEHMESDGTLWSTVGVYKFTSRTQVDMRRIVYKVGTDKFRKAIGEYRYKGIDLSLCQGDRPYPDLNARLGYLHSFCITENYIILPEAAYMMDPCVVFKHYDSYRPFFPQGFTFEKKAFSRLLVMRKSDGKFIADIKTTPFFVTHQLGSYEDGELIHMDMLMYNDASIYDRHTYVNSLLDDDPYFTSVSRITINTRDWTASIRNLRNGAPAALEMSNINYAYNGRKYTFGYMAKNFDQISANAITKLNVDTGDELDYVLEDGLFIQEPQFIPRPTGVVEDDGVIIAQGVDGQKKKGYTATTVSTVECRRNFNWDQLSLVGRDATDRIPETGSRKSPTGSEAERPIGCST